MGQRGPLAVAAATASWLTTVTTTTRLLVLPPPPPPRPRAAALLLLLLPLFRRTKPASRRLLHPFFLLSLLLVVLLPTPPGALADCECGYLSTIGDTGSSSTHTAVFTDLLETDFTRLLNDGGVADVMAQDTDWARQAFNLTRERARGEHGEMFAVEDVFVVAGGGGGGGANAQGLDGSPGLKLVVRSRLVQGMVPVAEVDTSRLDILWGTFRASMKMASAPGTCAAFFWYFNDTQEIDMEFLTKDFNATNSSYPVNLVLQSREAALAGYDAARTGNFVKAYLPFDPTGDFHEYRIDYTPGRVFFYADGLRLADMGGPAVPSSAGHLILQHWSNGNAYWSGGPPAEDSALTVRYVKAYFNSSSSQRQRDWAGRCRDAAAAKAAVCRIPDVTPTNSTAASWFFKDRGNMTNNNQTASGQSEASAVERSMWLMTMGLLLLLGLWAGAV